MFSYDDKFDVSVVHSKMNSKKIKMLGILNVLKRYDEFGTLGIYQICFVLWRAVFSFIVEIFVENDSP